MIQLQRPERGDFPGSIVVKTSLAVSARSLILAHRTRIPHDLWSKKTKHKAEAIKT